jgi:hypothetical protein
LNEYGNLRYVSLSGAGMVERGTGTGTLDCSVTVTMALAGVWVSGPFSAAAAHGDLDGVARAQLTSTTGRSDLFAGTLTLTHGSGSYARWSGVEKLTGTLNRANRDVTLHITGPLAV